MAKERAHRRRGDAVDYEEELIFKMEPSIDAKKKIQRMRHETLVFAEHHNGKFVRYQLNYLNLRARAEPIRLLLLYLKQPYDEKLENFEQFAKHKDKFPQPRLPKLVIHGRVEICYTTVILQYLARKYGLEPESSEEKANAEMLGLRLQEYFDYLRPFINCLLGFVPRHRLDDLREDVLRPCVRREFGPIFEGQLENNKTGYLVGENLSWIDFYAAAFTDQIHCFGGDPNLLEPYPNIQKHRKAVLALPQFEEYLRKRPKTRF